MCIMTMPRIFVGVHDECAQAVVCSAYKTVTPGMYYSLMPTLIGYR